MMSPENLRCYLVAHSSPNMSDLIELPPISANTPVYGARGACRSNDKIVNHLISTELAWWYADGHLT